MLFLLFQLGEDCYAVEAGRVVEILPRLDWKTLPGAPRGIAGVINYRNTAVPVVDVSELLLQRPAARQLSTRLLIVQADVTERRLALLTERATESIRLEPEKFQPSGVTSRGAPCLGSVIADAQGRLVQWVKIEELLSDDVRDALFACVASEA